MATFGLHIILLAFNFPLYNYINLRLETCFKELYFFVANIVFLISYFKKLHTFNSDQV